MCDTMTAAPGTAPPAPAGIAVKVGVAEHDVIEVGLTHVGVGLGGTGVGVAVTSTCVGAEVAVESFKTVT